MFLKNFIQAIFSCLANNYCISRFHKLLSYQEGLYEARLPPMLLLPFLKAALFYHSRLPAEPSIRKLAYLNAY